MLARRTSTMWPALASLFAVACSAELPIGSVNPSEAGAAGRSDGTGGATTVGRAGSGAGNGQAGDEGTGGRGAGGSSGGLGGVRTGGTGPDSGGTPGSGGADRPGTGGSSPSTGGAAEGGQNPGTGGTPSGGQGSSTGGGSMLWADTDALQYSLTDSGVATLHNDTAELVFLPGCNHYYYEQLVNGVWTDRGPEPVLCENDDTLAMRAGTTFREPFSLLTEYRWGSWRLGFIVGHGCVVGESWSADHCSSVEYVTTPPFTVLPECGDPTTMARYGQCSAAADATECEAFGGSWIAEGSRPDPFCWCPTGDGDCSCTKDSECLTMCQAPYGPGGIDDCSSVTEGTCAANTPIGCKCRLEDSGAVSTICID